MTKCKTGEVHIQIVLFFFTLLHRINSTCLLTTNSFINYSLILPSNLFEVVFINPTAFNEDQKIKWICLQYEKKIHLSVLIFSMIDYQHVKI